MRYAAADVRATVELHKVLAGVGAPVFFRTVPAGAYATPHAAPKHNPRTGERHPYRCPCEKCTPGSGCACYACRYEWTLRVLQRRREPAINWMKSER